MLRTISSFFIAVFHFSFSRKYTFYLLVGVLFSFINITLAQNPMKVKSFNFTTFHQQAKNISKDLLQLTPKAYHQHEEFGVLPYNAQCNNCEELLHKRTEHERYFIATASKGKHFYAQKSLTPLHYKNNRGEWITIDWRLKQTAPQYYEANHQAFPTAYNANAHQTILKVSKFSFAYNQNISKYFLDKNGNAIQTEAANYAHYSIGAEGTRINNAFSEINIEHTYKQQGIKTNYMLLEKPFIPTQAAYLVFEDKINLPNRFNIVKKEEALALLNDKNEHIITFEQPAFYDGYSYGMLGKYEVVQQENEWLLKVLVPVDFLQNPKVNYPLTIDPFVTIGPQGIGEFSVPFPATFNSANMGFTFGANGTCDYTITFSGLGTTNLINTYLDVEYENKFNPCNPNTNPVYCEFTDVSMEVIGPCNTSTGQLVCNPAQPPFNGTCTTDPLKVPGAGAILIPNFLNCIEAQCPDYFLSFTIKNREFKCSDSCSRDCATGHYFAVTLEGRILEEIVTISDDNICAGESVQVISLPSFGVPPYTYAWNPTGDIDSVITVNPETSTGYACIVTDFCGNTAEDDTIINVLPSPDADAGGVFTACEGTVETIGGNPTSVAGFNFTWNALPASNNNLISDATAANPNIFVPLDTTGTYTFVVRVEDATCFRLDTATLIVFQFPEPKIIPDSNLFICQGNEITLQTDTIYAAYNWSNGATTQSITITQPGTYSVTVSNGDCSSNNNTNVTVALKPLIDFDVLPQDTSFNIGGSVTLSANINLSQPDITNYYWEPNLEINCTNCEQPVATPTSDRYYYLYVEQEGCIGVDSAFVNLTFPNNYLIPTAFSPNNDGTNDLFFIIKQSGVTVLEFKVFNRWGEMVHDALFPWDGFYKGQLQDMEVFTYFFNLQLSNGETEIAKGNVSLIK